MPRFEPFAGLRYDPSRVDLSTVVAPPYDVVGPDERARLVARHSANSILVELPEPDNRTGQDRYEGAAAQLARWTDDGILRPRPDRRLLRLSDDRALRARHQRGARRARARRRVDRRHPSPRADAPQGQERPAGAPAGHPDQPLAHLGAVPAVRDSPPTSSRTGRPTPARVTATGCCTSCGSSTTRRRSMRSGRRWARPRWWWPTATTATRRRGPTAPNGAGTGRTPGADAVLALVVELAEDQLEVGPIHRVLSCLPGRPRPRRCVLLVVRRDPGGRLRAAHHRGPRAVRSPWRW